MLDYEQPLSSFLRLYRYRAGDFSAPHFDRAHFEHSKVTQKIEWFTAYSVLFYLNDGFTGGETTFFRETAEDLPNLSRRGLTDAAAELTVANRVSPR